MKHKLSIAVLVLMALFANGIAQQLVLSNKDVVEMVKAGFGADIINAKITGTEAAFDISLAALKELKDSGVPQDVILTMVKNPLGSKSAALRQPIAPASSGEPEYATIQDIKGLSKIYVRADDDDVRSTIIGMLRGYEGVEVVNSAKDAEIVLDYTTLTRDVAANRGSGAMGASMALKSQMRAYVTKQNGARLIAWTESETLDVVNAFTFSAPNEVNLTHHFVRDLQKARGEKTYSIRKLYQNAQKQRKADKAAAKP